MRALLVLAAVFVLASLGGCFKPSPQEGFACGPNHWCPDPLHCATDGTCRRTDVGGDAALGGGSDASGPDGDGSRPNLAFVMSTPLTAKALGPPAVADSTCTQFANMHGHPGTFVAWTSTMAISARSRLGTSRGWVRTDGRPFVDTIDDLVAGKIYYPLRKDEQGRDTIIPVMTGTNNDGTGNGEDCSGFTTDLSGLMSLGASDAGTSRWTQYDEQSCTGAFGVYCLEIGHDVQVAAPHEVGKLAFVSHGTFVPGGTITDADTLCQGEATAAGKSGTFDAFLATTQLTALSRFTPSNAPWVRVDGAATTTSFGTWDAPIAVTTAGDYIDDYVFSGATAPTVPAASGQDDCNNWTTSSGSSRVGFAAHGGPEAFGSSSGSCGPHRVLCLQL